MKYPKRMIFVRVAAGLLSVIFLAGCVRIPREKEVVETVTEVPSAVATETPTVIPTSEPTATPEPRYVERGALVGSEYLNPYFNFALAISDDWFCFPESYIQERNTISPDLEGYELEKRLKGLDDILMLISSSLNNDYLTISIAKQDSRARSLCSESDAEFEEYYNERIRSIHIGYGRKIQSIERRFDHILADSVLIQTVYENRDGSIVYDYMYYVLRNDYYLLLNAMFYDQSAADQLFNAIRCLESDYLIPVQEELEQNAAVLGQTMDLQYTNNYFGIGFKVPKDMYILSERELARMNYIIEDLTEQEFLDLLTNGAMKYVFSCSNEKGHNINIQISECNMDFFYERQLDEEAFAEYCKELQEQFEASFAAMNRNERVTTTMTRSYHKIGERIIPYTDFALKVGRDSVYMRTMVVTGGKYCLTVTIVVENSKQADAILAEFFAANSF